MSRFRNMYLVKSAILSFGESLSTRVVTMQATETKLFKFTHSFHQEMQKFKSIMADDPQRGRELYSKGAELVALASQGQYRKFCSSCAINFSSSSNADFPAMYFISKALEESLQAQHLMISAFIVDNGYPINDTSLPNVLLAVLKSDASDTNCHQVVEFLSTKQFEFNSQESKTWFSPLHYAVERGLLKTVQSLVEHGADVNAVADRDILPLNLATALTESENHNNIKEFLLSKGAKETWRRGEHTSGFVGFAPTESTSITVKAVVSTPTPKKMVSFRGGSSFPFPPPPPTTSVEADQLAPPQIPSDIPEINDLIDSTSNITISESDDGSMLFSTG